MKKQTRNPRAGLYVLMLSVHGLLRGRDPELGRDADTGGQILYVLELARALARRPGVDRVDLVTRQVHDARVGPDYAAPEERLARRAAIVRVPFGPRRYLRKELLWPHLDACVDAVIAHVRAAGRIPDLIHSHYADAGYVGVRLSALLGVPLLHTGHSLGRDKRARLLDQGEDATELDERYHFPERIEAEEQALDHAGLVIASTRQEVEEQYALYDSYHPTRMVVIPPGVNLDRFAPPKRGDRAPRILGELRRFLHDPDRPAILAIARADPRKNLAVLVHAFGNSPELREQANLVIVAGNRDRIDRLDDGAQTVVRELLELVDRYDLYGKVAYPKHHVPEDIPELYRWAARTGGVFVNPALTEPFGLTLLEAAASGLPVVSTKHGGPAEILRHCRNGQLVEPTDSAALARALRRMLSDWRRWRQHARGGLRGVEQHYSWQAHAQQYLSAARPLTRRRRGAGVPLKSRLPLVERLLVCDIDDTLLGDAAALKTLLARLRRSPVKIGFAVATGRHFDAAVRVLSAAGVPQPDIVISSVGTEIYYSTWDTPDESWAAQLAYRWQPEELRRVLDDFPGMRLQPKAEQGRFKVSYHIDDPSQPPSPGAVTRHLRKNRLQANVIVSKGRCLDAIPIRGSKGMAVRYLSMKWGIPPERILVAGDSGNDEEMLLGDVLGVVVGNHSPEIARLRGRRRIYFAEGHCAAGILEGIDHYGFFEARPHKEREPE